MKCVLAGRVLGVSMLAALIAGCANGYGDGDRSADGEGRVREQKIRDLREEGGEGTRVALAYPTGNRATSTILVERISPAEVRLGQPYEYQIKVTNLTNATLSGVVVREKLPGDFSVTKAEPQARVDGDVRAFEIGEIGPKASKTIRISGTPSKTGSLDSCVVVAYTPTLCSSTSVINPILKIVKEAAKDADVCEPIPFRYIVSNTGVGTERNVRIEQKLPEGLTTEDGKNVVAVVVGDLPEGTSKDVTGRVKAVRGGTFGGEAVARGGGKEVVSERVVTVVKAPKLEVSLRGPGSEYINKRATFVASVKNVGDAPARRTVMKIDAGGRADVLAAATSEEKSGGSFDKDSAAPPGTISRSGARSAADDSVKDLGTLAPGESRTVEFSLRMAREGEMKVTASASAECAAAADTSIVTNVGTLPALRLEVVDLEDAIKVGENVIYRITVKNQGSGDDEDVRIVATLPDEETFVRASGSSDAKVEGKVITFEPVLRLEPQKTAEWRVEAKASRPGDVRFEVKMTSKSLTKPAVETEPTRLY